VTIFRQHAPAEQQHVVWQGDEVTVHRRQLP
jgi:hypothetical protein